MNKKILINILAVSLLISVTGCDDYLNNVPKGMTIPQYMEDYQKLLNSQSLINASDGMLDYLTDNIHLLDKNATASYYIYINKDESVRNLYSFKPGQVYVEGTKDYIWNNAYERLFTLNTVINEVMDSKGGSEEAKLRIKAEALFGRAY
jgi:hypothetical protein